MGTLPLRWKRISFPTIGGWYPGLVETDMQEFPKASLGSITVYNS